MDSRPPNLLWEVAEQETSQAPELMGIINIRGPTSGNAGQAFPE